jgi:hypothetical protein
MDFFKLDIKYNSTIMKISRRKAIRNSVMAATGTAFISGIPQDSYGSTKEMIRA